MATISRRDALKLGTAGLALGATGKLTADERSPREGATPSAGRRPRARYLIVACDGGGIRGLLTARIIQQLQKELPNEQSADKSLDFCNRIDCFAGTSTGGIIALGLACKVAPADLVKLYRDKGKVIFKEFRPSTDDLTILEKKFYPQVMRALESLEMMKVLKALQDALPDALPPGWPSKAANLLFVQHDSSGLQGILKEMLKPEWTLGKLPSNKSVIVTTFQLDRPGEGWQPVILHNLKTGETEEERIGKRTTVIDAALCTSAAPMYFPPHRHPDLGYCADGGLFASSPGAAALTTALRAGKDANDIRLLSIGTGSKVNHMKVPPWLYGEETKGTRCGVMAWMSPYPHAGVPSYPLMNALFDSAAAADIMFCKGILRDRFRRIQVRLEKDMPFNGADAKKIKGLDDLADAYFKTVRWEDDKRWIINNFLAE